MKQKLIDTSGIDATAAAVREFGRAFLGLARADYKWAGEPYGPTAEGFRRWYRKVYEVTPDESVRYPEPGSVGDGD